ncbi:MAG: fibrobacter succinogenes major paralogous domain-containing protein [Flavobacteriales bacterium]
MKAKIYFVVLTVCLLSTSACKDNRGNQPSPSTANTARDSSHKTVLINGNMWFAENLTVSQFRNGDPIAYAKSAEEWVKYAEQQLPAYAYCHFDSLNFSHSGKLYNWYAVDDSRKLAPQGWRIPSESDWRMLEKHCSATYITVTDIEHPENIRFGTDELADSADWGYGKGTNKSGFKALPADYLNDLGEFEFGTGWWTSTSYISRKEYGDQECENCAYCFTFSALGRDRHNVAPQGYGLYVRCIESE